MDKRYFTLFFLLLFVGFAAVSQDLKITKIEASRLSKALIDRVTDPISGEECAVLHIKTEGLTPEERDLLDFELDYASTIANRSKDGGEILLYVPPRTVLLVVKSPFGNYRADFCADFGFKDGTVKLKDYDVYIEYNRPAPVPDPEADMGGQYFVLTVTPATADVYIDGELCATDDGKLTIMLPYGEHKYRIEALSFVGDEGTFTIGKTKVTKTVTLVSAQEQLTLSCADALAELYLNGKKIGTGSWSGSLAAGMYIVEARRAGYSTVKQSLTLAKQERRSLALDAPEPIYGKLNINSTPDSCDVYLDGEKIGTSPDIFSNVLIGTHSIELRKRKYASVIKQVTIEENEIAQVTITLSNIKTFTVNGVSFEMVLVEGGTFTMGATSEQGSDAYDSEKPSHNVTLSDYYIGKFEVTQELWEAVMGSNPSYFKGNKLPVEKVSWDDCQNFIKKLNKLCAEQLNGMSFRLPTEAEWEYAARGGSKSKGYKYSGSNNINDVAWYTDNSGSKTHTVGTKSPNELGIYDMSGNVWEWCQDWYGSYGSGSQTNPQGPSSGSDPVDRGGGWNCNAKYCRVSYRGVSSPDSRYNVLGFRLVAPSFIGDEGTFIIRTHQSDKDGDTRIVSSSQALLTLSCGDASAELYLNDKKIGTGKWDVCLNAGMYVVEARKAGHSTVKQSLTLAKQEQRSLILDAPEPIYGKLNINSTPDSCDVYFDGKKIGISPDIFSNVLIGTHSIELRKAGYASATEQVTIEENEIAQVTITLSNIKTFTVNGVFFEMVLVEGGTFTMGATSEQGSDADSDEKPAHRVRLDDYYIGQFEVTQELWEAVMGSEPIYNGGWNNKYGVGKNYPAYQVSWKDCQKFIKKLNKLCADQLNGKSFRLPTEAEWEYAARGGNRSRGYKYSGSNNISEVAWCWENSGDNVLSGVWGYDKIKKNNCKTHPVGTKSPNELGIYDMSGNVNEWCQDRYGDYSSGSQTNPQGPSSGSDRVRRGGSWSSYAGSCRVSNRNHGTPDYRFDGVGFRLVLVP